MAIFDNFNWDRVLTGAIGQTLASRSNRRAVDTAQRTAEQQIAAIRAGQGEANARLNQIAEEARPDMEAGSGYFRTVMAADPHALKPGQKQLVDDARTAAARSPIVRTSGRGGSAMIADTTNRIIAGQVDRNLAERERAAQALMGRGLQGVNIQTQVAQNQIQGGNQAANIIGQAGNTSAAADLASTQSMLGVLGSVLANDRKDEMKQQRIKEGTV